MTITLECPCGATLTVEDDPAYETGDLLGAFYAAHPHDSDLAHDRSRGEQARLERRMEAAA